MTIPLRHTLPDQPEAARTWRSLDEGRQELREVLEDFLRCPGPVDGNEPCSALAIAATVGVGKSSQLRLALAEQAARFLRCGHILIYVPTHALAEEAEHAFRALGTGLPSMVFRGRQAKDPTSGAALCEKPALAERIGQAQWGVGSALCQARDPGTGELRRAPCRTLCAWYEQFPGNRHSIIFLPHAYLRAPVPKEIRDRVALRVIDESFVSAISWTQTMYVDEWLEGCACDEEAENGASPCIHRARRVVHAALLDQQPIAGALEAAGIHKNMMDVYADKERKALPVLEVTPWMARGEQEARVAKFNFRAFFRARARARLWTMLAEDWHRGRSDRISLGSVPAGSPDLPAHCVIKLHGRADIPRDAPLILLDADANPRLTEALVPGAKFVSILVRPNAEVIQISDRTFSDTSLLMQPRAEEHRKDILDLVRKEADASQRGTLLVTTRAVLRQLHLDADPSADVGCDDALLQPLLGAHPRWFGPRMQGVNTYEDFDTVIVVGRIQPRIDGIEDSMRAIFGQDDDAPVTFMPADLPTRGWYQKHKAFYEMSDGTRREAVVRSHPDERGAALLGLTREASLIQAIGRIRAVRAGAPKRILILCSLPLPGLPVDRLLTWPELVTGLPAGELTGRARKLEAALFPGGSPARGLRLSAAGILEDAPTVFTAPTAGASWRRDLTTGAVRDMVRAIARRRQIHPTFVTLRPARGGKDIPAVLIDAGEDPDRTVRDLWPDLELVAVERPSSDDHG